MDREGTGDVSAHISRDSIGKCVKTKNILHSTCFFLGEHVINFVMRGDNGVLYILCEGSVGSVTAHVTLVGGGGTT